MKKEEKEEKNAEEKKLLLNLNFPQGKLLSCL